MSGRGKGKSAKKAVSRSTKAGLQVCLGAEGLYPSLLGPPLDVSLSPVPHTCPSFSPPLVVCAQFPVGRVARYLKKGKYATRIGAGAPVYLAAVLEYLAAEVRSPSASFPFSEFRKRVREVQLGGEEGVGHQLSLSRAMAAMCVAPLRALSLLVGSPSRKRPCILLHPCGIPPRHPCASSLALFAARS